MATITTDKYYDEIVGLTAAETITVQIPATLTVRTDTRVHANAPASMTGCFGDMTISYTLKIDGTKVRWLAYDTGTGNVPAIGTSITQAGVSSSYLLGVWESLTSAPTAVGAAMPATGFIKFREVTGAFIAGALTGIGASATGADVNGWLEIVMEQSKGFYFQRTGDGFVVTGDWFYLDDITGVAGQQIQCPTNGGGSGTLIPGIQIETGVGTNIYEWYPALRGSNYGWDATKLCTDKRAKFVEAMDGGIVRIGSNGTNNIGFIPTSGCKVRIPNVIGRQCTAAARASNAVPHATFATRPDFYVVSPKINLDKFITDWYMSFSGAAIVDLLDCCFSDTFAYATYISIAVENYCNGLLSTPAANIVSVSTNTNYGITSFKNCKFVGACYPNVYHGTSFNQSSGTEDNYMTFDNCSFFGSLGVVARSTDYRCLYFSLCNYVYLKNCNVYNQGIFLNACSNFIIENLDYVDRMFGDTNGSNGVNLITMSACKDFLIDGFTFGERGTISNCQCYGAILVGSLCTEGNIVMRNIGNRTTPLAVGTAYAPSHIYYSGTSDNNFKIQRCYLSATRSAAIFTAVNNSNMVLQNCSGTLSQTSVNIAQNSVQKGMGSVPQAGGDQNSYGVSFSDHFLSDTTGKIYLYMKEPTSQTSQYFTAIANDFLFSGSGNIYLKSIGEQFVYEMSYYALGHTGFANIEPIINASYANTISPTYQIDKNDNNGWSDWKVLNASTLSAESISASDGFKLKIKVTTNQEPSLGTITAIGIHTLTTASAQINNLYPLDYASFVFSGYPLGTRLQIYNVDTDRELYNEVPSSTTMEIFIPYTCEINEHLHIRTRAMYIDGSNSRMFFEVEDNPVYTWANVLKGVQRPINMIDDEVYNENAIDGSLITGVTIDDDNLLVNINDSNNTISWAEIYAYESYWLTTEAGIRDQGRFIEAVDPVNYTIYGFKIKNTSDPSVPLEITGGYGVDSVTGKSITLVDNTGGTIFNSPDHIVKYKPELTATDVWGNATRTLTAIGTSGIAAEASLIEAADVWSSPTRELTGIGVSGIAAETSLIDTNDIWSSVLEGSYTASDILKILSAFAAGKTTITPIAPGQATVIFRDINNTRDTITAGMDENERASMTINI